MACRTTPPASTGVLQSDLTIERLHLYQMRQTLVASLEAPSNLDPQLVTYTCDDSIPVSWSDLPRPAIACEVRTVSGEWESIAIETYWRSMDDRGEGVVSNFLFPRPARDPEDNSRRLNQILGWDTSSDGWERMAIHVTFELRAGEIWLRLFSTEVVVDLP